jgi:hypothetical protein
MPSNVSLDDREWGQVMNILADAPWKVSNPLLMKIGDQLRAQHQPQQQAPMPHDFKVDANGKEANDGQ